MPGRFSNACIWRIENTVSEINQLLCYKYPKRSASIIDCKWLAKDDLSSKTIKINDQEISYIAANASINLLTQNLSALHLTEELKKRAELLFTKSIQSELFFIDQTNYQYIVVIGSQGIESRIRNNLMHVNKDCTLSWKNLEHDNVKAYSFDSSFFYWIVNKNGAVFTLKDKPLKLCDIKGFKCSTERTRNTYDGEGFHVYEEVPLESLISLDEKLISLYIEVLYENIKYSFYLESNGRLSLCLPECGENVTACPKPISCHELVFNIYFCILPFLKQEYNKAVKSDWVDNGKNFRKCSAANVIYKLMKKNDISIDELNTLLSELGA